MGRGQFQLVTEFSLFSAKTGHVAYCGSLDIPKPWSSIDLHRGRFRPTRPLAMRHNVGGPIRDVVITGSTGWSLFPVTVYDKNGRRMSGFHGFQVLGECGPIDWRRSEVVPVTLPGGVFPRLKGMYFLDGTWDGSDIFGPTDKGFTFMTDQAASALTRSKISNMDLEAIEDVITDIWPGDMQPGWKHLWGKTWESLSPTDMRPST